MKRLLVEIHSAQNLMPKDGFGSCSAYVIAEFDGQRKRTCTIHRDLHPQWCETLRFRISDPSCLPYQTLQFIVCGDDLHGKRDNFLGRVKISGSSFVKKGLESLVFYPLEKKKVFSQVRGELGVKICYADEEEEAVEIKQAEAEGEAVAGVAVPAEVEEEQQKAQHDQNEFQELVHEGQEHEHQPEPEPELDQNGWAEFVPVPEEEIRKEMVFPTPEEETGNEHKTDQNQELKVAEDAPDTENRNCEGYAPFKVVNDVGDGSAEQYCYAAMDETGSGDESLMSNAFFIAPPLQPGSYDLVEEMPFLYVKVVKARNFSGAPSSYAVITIGDLSVRTRTVGNNDNPEWGQVFAIAKNKISSTMLKIKVLTENAVMKDEVLGSVQFDLQEVPRRVPPDSPLAPQWYRMETRSQSQSHRAIMLCVWSGTQADEAFPLAWQSDTGGLLPCTRSQFYLSPKLWYLRVHVVEAQEVCGSTTALQATVKGVLGSQCFRTKICPTRGSNPSWHEDLVFVAAEPFEEHLLLMLQNRLGPGSEETLGVAAIPLNRVHKSTSPRTAAAPTWLDLEIEEEEEDQQQQQGEQQRRQEPVAAWRNKIRTGRIQVTACLEGGYHVLDEPACLSSDYRAASQSLCKDPAVGVLDVGMLGANNLVAMNGPPSTSAYCVAKYGRRWVRTRTILHCTYPRWNEQCTMDIYDPCTVLTIAVFHNNNNNNSSSSSTKSLPHLPLGKLRIRVSTLKSNKTYRVQHPLYVVYPGGVTKTGTLLVSVRFRCRLSAAGTLALYLRPLWPHLHYVRPLSVAQQDALRRSASAIVGLRLSRCESPLRRDVVAFVLDQDLCSWSLRKCKANWSRITALYLQLQSLLAFLHDLCCWRFAPTTLLAHFLLLFFVCNPHLILPSLFLSLVFVGASNYRKRGSEATGRSAAEAEESYEREAYECGWDELDEEFDTFPTSRSMHVVRARYDRLRFLGGRLQQGLGRLAEAGERVTSLLAWRDPRASWIFVSTCLACAVALYVVPLRTTCVVWGFYLMRHPRWRQPAYPYPYSYAYAYHAPRRRVPSPLINFLSRLPSLSDSIF